MKRVFSLLFAIALMTTLAYNVFAQEDPGAQGDPPGFMGMGRMQGRGPMMAQVPEGSDMMRGMGPMMLGPEMMDKLELTKEQKDNIENIRTSHRKDMIAKNAERSLAEIDLRDMLKKDKPDMNLIKDQLQKIANISVDIQYARIKTQMDVKNVLTDEQKAKLEQFAKERKAGMAKKDMQNQRQKPNVRPNERPSNRPR